MNRSLSHPSERDRLVARLRAVEDALANHGIEHLAIYGSRARRDFRLTAISTSSSTWRRTASFLLIDLIKVEHELPRKARHSGECRHAKEPRAAAGRDRARNHRGVLVIDRATARLEHIAEAIKNIKVLLDGKSTIHIWTRTRLRAAFDSSWRS